MIKIEDLTFDEIIELYAGIRKGNKQKELGLNAYEAITRLLEAEITRRHKESPLG